MAAAGGGTSRRWCYTVYNDDWNSPEALPSQVLRADDPAIYACGQFERSPETGRIHFQAYAEFNKPRSGRQSAVDIGLPATCHREIARGSSKQCRDYCRKTESALPGTFIEVGNWNHDREQGAKPMDKFYEDVKAGVPLQRLLWERPALYSRARHVVGLLAGLAPRPPRSAPRVYFFVGGTGTGKTRRAESITGTTPWISSFCGGHPWFTGYMGQQVAVLDDLRDSVLRLPFLLRLLDRYRMDVEIKGSTVEWRPELVIITTNLALDRWYPAADQLERDALSRRITDIWNFKLLEDGSTDIDIVKGNGQFPIRIDGDGVIKYD